MRCALALTIAAFAPALADDTSPSLAYFDETEARTLFAFDDVSIPFTRNLRLQMHQPGKHPANPVVPRGKSGQPDSWAVQFYGSVIRAGGKFRMWYAAAGDERGQTTEHNSSYWRPAYAESTDGIHWTKPQLGLVEYRGSRNNNLLLLEPAMGTINLKVLYEPHQPDPQQRYKMAAHVYYHSGQRRHGTLAPYASADGLRWKLLIDAEPVNAELPMESRVVPALHIEPAGGLYKWDGLYYSSGQNPLPATRPYHGRVVRTYRSPDFVSWSQTSSVGFVRSAQHALLPSRRDGEQTHEGVSVWNRGNVLLGVYGIWHGAREWKDVTIDLGFLVSNDGVRFREPANEWVFLKRGADGLWDQGGLLQAQGFENVGHQTFIYYGAADLRTWTNYAEPIPPRGGVGLATLRRDRFGDLRLIGAEGGTAEFVTAPLATRADTPLRLYINADGLGEDAALKVELLNRKTIPIAEFSGENAAVVRDSGFQTPVVWKGKQGVRVPAEYVRLKVTFEGRRNSDIRFSALYLR